MKIHLGLLNLSAWLALITLIIVPGEITSKGIPIAKYGFPFRFYTQIHSGNVKSVWLIQGISINLLYFLLNIVFIYLLSILVWNIKEKKKRRR